ncbi:kynurenine--oxoglutarate transaminase 1 isoform X1 [Sus scrofa]|uniref:Kynurenine--oxoglutarate transaminase 1 n=2 Tax=Sus scrofa TaxID=9823 RepID=A0A8D1U832_PIG|nr:kynurenine--oxoglutarate transaminase 1 isoform X1 [Sus scrofa]
MEACGGEGTDPRAPAAGNPEILVACEAAPECLLLAMAKRLQARRLDGIDHNPWVEFVKLASEADVVNLGQGFPDFPPPDFALEAFQHAVSGDFMLNQYTKAFGYPPLTKILASFFGKLLGQELDPLKNVLVTVGAYGALFTAFQALVDEGDEVIIIEPFFDCYEPMTLMAGGLPVFVSLKPSPAQDGELDSSSNWQLDPMELASKFTPRTKALVLNTPNNPLGKVFSKPELELVASLCQQHDVVCIADEVYQWLVYDQYQHISIASLPGMWERTLTVGSAGKTFSATGWKVGWVLGPDRLLRHLRTVHQNSVFHCPTQAQAAVAQSFEREQLHFGQPSSYFVQLPQAVQRSRDHMVQSLQSVGLRPIVPQGSYFLIIDVSDFKKKMPDLPGAADEPYDRRFVKWMIKNKGPVYVFQALHFQGCPTSGQRSQNPAQPLGLMAIPVSIFFSLPHQKLFDHYIRFCFMKDESTLQAMDEKLQKWKEGLRP